MTSGNFTLKTGPKDKLLEEFISEFVKGAEKLNPCPAREVWVDDSGEGGRVQVFTVLNKAADKDHLYDLEASVGAQYSLSLDFRSVAVDEVGLLENVQKVRVAWVPRGKLKNSYSPPKGPPKTL